MGESTYCINCKHFYYQRDLMIWYDCFCKASPAKTETNYTTGKTEFVDGKPHAYTQDINRHGNCSKFERK